MGAASHHQCIRTLLLVSTIFDLVGFTLESWLRNPTKNERNTDVYCCNAFITFANSNNQIIFRWGQYDEDGITGIESNLFTGDCAQWKGNLKA